MLDEDDWNDFFLEDEFDDIPSERDYYKNTTLAKYYDSNEWWEKRQQKLRWNKILNDGLCERCNKKLATDVHHKHDADAYKYVEQYPGWESPSDLEALCHECHKRFHPNMR